MGVEDAAAIGIAAAAMSLFCAALVGGPIARYLTERKSLETADPEAKPVVGVGFYSEKLAQLDYLGFVRTMVIIYIAIIVGYALH